MSLAILTRASTTTEERWGIKISPRHIPSIRGRKMIMIKDVRLGGFYIHVLVLLASRSSLSGLSLFEFFLPWQEYGIWKSKMSECNNDNNKMKNIQQPLISWKVVIVYPPMITCLKKQTLKIKQVTLLVSLFMIIMKMISIVVMAFS